MFAGVAIWICIFVFSLRIIDTKGEYKWTQVQASKRKTGDEDATRHDNGDETPARLKFAV